MPERRQQNTKPNPKRNFEKESSEMIGNQSIAAQIKAVLLETEGKFLPNPTLWVIPTA
jgi:hypothetical protein